MSYQYNPHTHVKIWLSNNPDVFMNLENQFRLIEMREKNPQDTIYLVYDSSLLNDKSLAELNKYCQENYIISINADKFIDDLESDNEQILYMFYKDEIEHLQEGGNLAVASDIIRWLPPIYRRGTYTDFDFPIDTTALPEKIEVEAPLLLNIGSLSIWKQLIFSNNDYIAIVDEFAAKEKIEQVQTALISKLKKYDTDFIEKCEQALGDDFLNSYLTSFIENRSESIYLKKIKLVNARIGEKSSRNLRAYIHEVMTDKDKFLDFYKLSKDEPHTSVIKRLRSELSEQLGGIKWLFFRKDYDEIEKVLLQDDDKFVSKLMKRERSLYLKAIVICTTGPIEIANALFNGSVLHTKEFDKQVRPFSFNKYGLQKAFQSKNSIPIHENILSMLKFLGTGEGTLNDSSWLEKGRKLQELRQEKLICRQKQLASTLPFDLLEAKIGIENHIKKMEKEASECFGFFRKTINEKEIAMFKQILNCYHQDKQQFNIVQFKGILINNIHPRKNDNRSQKLIENLEQLCHDAVVYRLATIVIDTPGQKEVKIEGIVAKNLNKTTEN